MHFTIVFILLCLDDSILGQAYLDNYIRRSKSYLELSRS